MCRAAFGILKSQPAVELELRLSDGRFHTGNALGGQRRVVALGDKGNLVFEIRKAIVHRCSREHQNAGFDALFNDPAHQAVIARLARVVG